MFFAGLTTAHPVVHGVPMDYQQPGDFTFPPTPQVMSPDQFWGFVSSATPEQQAYARSMFLQREAGTSATPTPLTTALVTPSATDRLRHSLLLCQAV